MEYAYESAASFLKSGLRFFKQERVFLISNNIGKLRIRVIEPTEECPISFFAYPGGLGLKVYAKPQQW